MVTLDQSIDGSISDAALRMYLNSGRPSAGEKRSIRKFLYACEHGPTAVRTEPTGNDSILARFSQEHEYRETFDKTVNSVMITEPYRIRFHELNLLALTMEDRYSWADETFVGYYTGRVDHGVTERAAARRFDNEDCILKQYKPPRSADGTVPSGFVLEAGGLRDEPWEEESVVLAWKR